MYYSSNCLLLGWQLYKTGCNNVMLMLLLLTPFHCFFFYLEKKGKKVKINKYHWLSFINTKWCNVSQMPRGNEHRKCESFTKQRKQAIANEGFFQLKRFVQSNRINSIWIVIFISFFVLDHIFAKQNKKKLSKNCTSCIWNAILLNISI